MRALSISPGTRLLGPTSSPITADCGTFSSVQSLSCVQLFETPWTAAHQASLSITNSQSLLKLMSIESMMLSNHLFLSRPLLLLPSIFPSIRVFSNESVLCIRWPKYWSFSFSISPSNEYSGLISFRMDWLELLSVLLLNALQILSKTSQTQSVTKTHVSPGLTLKHCGRILHEGWSTRD